jgi:hypothetical protein
VGQPVDAAALRPLRRMLRENHQRNVYINELSKIVSMGDQRVRTVAISIDQASEFLDVDTFPEGFNRTWGGARDAIDTWHDS